MFESILNFKVKWPKGFDPVARDLVQKLLKIKPEERISLEEMLEHPWFAKNPALWPVAPSVLGQTLQMEGDI